jgi:acetyl-CoA synthetase
LIGRKATAPVPDLGMRGFSQVSPEADSSLAPDNRRARHQARAVADGLHQAWTIAMAARDTRSRAMSDRREPLIEKPRGHGRVAPNMPDWDAARASFTWDEARAALDGLPGGGGLNIAHEAVDRHAAGARAERVAIRWLGRAGGVEAVTFRDLAERSARFANVLGGLGVAAGDHVFALTGRIPAL